MGALVCLEEEFDRISLVSESVWFYGLLLKTC